MHSKQDYKLIKTKNILYPKGKYRLDIDGLRALAVIGATCHNFLRDFAPCGYLGVDMFTVISGYVITSSIAGRENKSLIEFASNFYEKRVKRLVPALVICVLIVSILICLFVPQIPSVADRYFYIKTGITSLFGFSNLYLVRHSTDYFSTAAELNPFTHLWSLGVEEQYYLVYPFLLWITGFAQQKEKGVKKLLILILFLSSLSLISFIYGYKNDPTSAYFLIQNRFWEIGLGCIAFLITYRRKYNVNSIYILPTYIVFTLLFGVFFLPYSYSFLATFLVVIFTFILLCFNQEKSILYKVLTNNIFVYLGKRSYSIYLWRWSLVAIFQWTVGISALSIPFQLLLLLSISELSYKFIESPFRFNFWSGLKLKTILYGIFLNLSASLSLVFVNYNLATNLRNIGTNLVKPFYPFYKPLYQNFYCAFPRHSLDTAIDNCLKIREKETINLYLIGSSHAAEHYPSINNAIKEFKKVKINFLVDYGFIYDLLEQNIPPRLKNAIPNSFTKHLNFFEENLTESSVVIFNLSRTRIKTYPQSLLPRKTDLKTLNSLKKNIIKLNTVIKKRGARLLLVDDYPQICQRNSQFQFPIHINMRGEIDRCSVKKEISLIDRADLSSLYKSLDNQFQNIDYVDFHEFLCPDTYCKILDENNNLIYTDKSPHFSSYNPTPLIKPWKKYLRYYLKID